MYLGLDLVLLNYLRKTNKNLARDFTETGTAVAVLDQEGGVMPDANWFQSKLPSPSVCRLIKVFFSWGDHLAAFCIDHDIFGRDQICITGSPRMDLLVEPNRSVVQELSKHEINFEGPLILINTRLSLVNPETGTQIAVRLQNAKITGREVHEIEEWQAIQQSALEETANTANRLATKFPGVHFVLRPHPFENVQTYNPLLKELPNLHLTREGSIQGWLVRASAIIQRCCSTAIEAGLVGVPVFSPCWIAMPQEIESAESVSVGCQDFEELARQIETVIAGTYSIPPFVGEKLSEIVPKWFHQVDGKAHQRIADRILLELHNMEKPDAGKMRQMYYEFHPLLSPSSRLQTLTWKMIRFLNLPVTTLQKAKVFDKYGKLESWKKSSKGFSVAQVQEMLDGFSSPGTYGASIANGNSLGRLTSLFSVRIVKKT